MSGFKDHFSGHAHDYACYRPRYPSTLFSYISGLTVDHDMAWDCGTGSGQAALGLAPFYSKVYATDPSTTQIANAVRHPAITYVAATAENCGLADHSVNAVTVAQALHWFDLHAFYREVKRVARSQAVLVAWCYGLTRIDHEIDAIIEHYYNATVGSYWPPERRYIDEQYRTLPFPWEKITRG